MFHFILIKIGGTVWVECFLFYFIVFISCKFISEGFSMCFCWTVVTFSGKYAIKNIAESGFTARFQCYICWWGSFVLPSLPVLQYVCLASTHTHLYLDMGVLADVSWFYYPPFYTSRGNRLCRVGTFDWTDIHFEICNQMAVLVIEYRLK